MSSKAGIVKEGWLKRVKNQKRRYFVLCFNKDTGAAQLQYHETERKFNSKAEPKRTIYLQDCLGIISKQDPKYGRALVLYTKDDIFAVTAETDEVLESWFTNLDKLHKMENKNLQDSQYDLVWNVKVIPRGLGSVKKITGSYKMCLKADTLYFVNLTTEEVLIEEKLYHVRRYGHMDYCFFMEFGRSTTLGAGEIWMEVEDPLIAQKIHETLSRSVAPPSGEHPPSSPRKKSERHSMVINPKNYIVEPITNNNNNNNNNASPKSRRLTLFENIFSKKKDTTRPHSKSMSGTPGLTQEDAVAERLSKFSLVHVPRKGGDDDDSEEESLHYPQITPPVPSVGKRTHKSSFSGSLGDNIHLSSNKKGQVGGDVKPTRGGNVAAKSRENDYSNVKPRRRSVKQDCNAVRLGYAADKRRSASLPRRPSSTSTEPGRQGSDVENGGNESDKDGDGSCFNPSTSHYRNMNPRQRITSDSSSEELGLFTDASVPYLPMRQKVSSSSVEDPPSYVPMGQMSGASDVYMKMSTPGSTPNLEKTRHPTSSPRSSASSYNSPDEASGLYHDGDISSYVNMAPGQLQSIGSSSAESVEDTNEEIFDHLNRDDHPGDENAVSSTGGMMGCVNMRPQSSSSGSLKKSQSQVERGSKSDYVNVSINRSKSVGSKRPQRVFQIVPEDACHRTSDDETCRHMPSSYVNISAKSLETSSSDSNIQYSNLAPLPQRRNGGLSERRNLNYASVNFENKPSGVNGIHGGHPSGRNSPSNYSKIDFQKSRGLAEISRERQLHGNL